jgi:hypothetical protein
MALNLRVEHALSTTAQPVKDQRGHASSLTLSTDKVGIGTTSPQASLDTAGGIGVHGVNYTTGGAALELNVPLPNLAQVAAVLGSTRAVIPLGVWGNPTTFYASGGTDAPIMSVLSSGNVEVIGSVHTSFASAGNLTGVTIGNNGPQAPKLEFNRSDNSKRFWLQTNDINSPTERLSLYGSPLGSNATNEMVSFNGTGFVGIWTTNPQAQLDVNGNIVTNGDISLTNADCAEDFDVEDAQALEPGTVMVVGDADRLHQSEEAYDTRAAGVLSGAGATDQALS